MYSKGGEVPEQAVQRSCECPIPEGIQGQVGQGPGQPELVGGSPAYDTRWDWMGFMCLPAYTVL